MTKIFRFLVCACLFLQFFCSNQDESRGVRSTVINGVKHISNSTNPIKGRISFELEKVFEVDSFSAGLEDPIFFHQVQQDSAGYTYFAENRSPKIHIFNEKGTWLRSFSIEGDGPGEFSRMGDLQIIDNQVWIAGNWPMKIAQYRSDGDFIFEWLSDKFYNFYLMTWIIDRERFLTVSFHQDQGFRSPERSRVLALIDQNENILHSYFYCSKAGPFILTVGGDSPIQVAFSEPVIVPRILHAYDHKRDILYCLFNREYKIELKNLAGKELMVVSRDHENKAVKSEDKEELVDLLAGRMSLQVQAEIKDKLPDVFCAISGIVPLNNGYFAVKRVTGVKTVELDIFDQEGRYVYLVVPSEDVPNLDSIHFFENSAGQIVHLEDRDVYTAYRIANLPEIY